MSGARGWTTLERLAIMRSLAPEIRRKAAKNARRKLFVGGQWISFAEWQQRLLAKHGIEVEAIESPGRCAFPECKRDAPAKTFRAMARGTAPGWMCKRHRNARPVLCAGENCTAISPRRAVTPGEAHARGRAWRCPACAKRLRRKGDYDVRCSGCGRVPRMGERRAVLRAIGGQWRCASCTGPRTDGIGRGARIEMRCAGCGKEPRSSGVTLRARKAGAPWICRACTTAVPDWRSVECAATGCGARPRRAEAVTKSAKRGRAWRCRLCTLKSAS